jgi:hypothetical protein
MLVVQKTRSLQNVCYTKKYLCGIFPKSISHGWLTVSAYALALEKKEHTHYIANVGT